MSGPGALGLGGAVFPRGGSVAGVEAASASVAGFHGGPGAWANLAKLASYPLALVPVLA